jgi:hypothetical protein
LICADEVLSRVDFQYQQAFKALSQEQSGKNEQLLMQEDKIFTSFVTKECAISRNSASSKISPTIQNCVREQYERQRHQWLSRLQTPDAKQEAERNPEAHVRIQNYLKQWFGSFDDGMGLYEGGTRSAITTWQAQHGRPMTGLLSDADAATIERELGRVQNQSTLNR